MAHALEVRKDGPGPPQQTERFVLAIKSVGRRFETPYERDSYEPVGGTRTGPWVGLSPTSGGTLASRTCLVGLA